MAVDTRDRRFSMMGLLTPVGLMANPDGTIADADRAQLLWLYPGISIVAVGVVALALSLRAVALTLEARPDALTLESRSVALAMPVRSVALTTPVRRLALTLNTGI